MFPRPTPRSRVDRTGTGAGLCALWAETATAPMNIALIGVIEGIPLTGPDGAVALARIRSFVEARLPRAPMLLRTFRPTRSAKVPRHG